MDIILVHQDDPVAETLSFGGADIISFHDDVYTVRGDQLYRVSGVGTPTLCRAVLVFKNDGLGGLFTHLGHLYVTVGHAGRRMVYEIQP